MRKNMTKPVPAFTRVAPDTTEMNLDGRVISLTQGRDGGVSIGTYGALCYQSLSLHRDEAQAFCAELQRVLALPLGAAA